MVKIGDNARCPQCNELSRIVWVSQDGKQAGIRCPGHHSQMSRGHSKLGSTARPETKREKNMVFLMEIDGGTSASTQR